MVTLPAAVNDALSIFSGGGQVSNPGLSAAPPNPSGGSVAAARSALAAWGTDLLGKVPGQSLLTDISNGRAVQNPAAAPKNAAGATRAGGIGGTAGNPNIATGFNPQLLLVAGLVLLIGWMLWRRS